MSQMLSALCRTTLIVAGITLVLTAFGLGQTSQVFFAAETGHWYRSVIVPEGRCWTDNRDSAAALGGYLATILSQSEQNFLSANLADNLNATNLGGYEPLANGVWAWVTGEPWGYTNWIPGEPLNIGGIEDYLGICWTGWCGDGGWNDIPNCPTNIRFIAEYNFNPDSVAWCDDFDDANGWQSRWIVTRGNPTSVSSPTHSGTGAVSFFTTAPGECHTNIYRKNFLAGIGEYSGWFRQTRSDAGQAMWVLVQPEPDTSAYPDFKNGYYVGFHAQDGLGGGTFGVIRDYDATNQILLGTKPSQFLLGEWVRAFARVYPNRTFIAGYERTNGFRDSIIVQMPEPLIGQGRFYLGACAHALSVSNYWDDACYTPDLPPLAPDTLRIGNPDCPETIALNKLLIPIYIDNADTVKGFDIPLKYSSPSDVESLITVGTRMAGLSAPLFSKDVANNKLRLIWNASGVDPNDVLTPVTPNTTNIPVAYLRFGYTSTNQCVDEVIANFFSPDTVTLPTGNVTIEIVDKLGFGSSPDLLFGGTLVRQFVTGDANGQAPVSIADAVFLINYIFAGGAAPWCLAAADADCNGAISIADAVYIINYIFAGGPVPGANCLCGAGPVLKPNAASSEIGVVDVDQTQSITLTNSTTTQALQLHFAATGQLENVQVICSDPRFQVFSGWVENEYRVGVIDLTGKTTLPAGIHDLLTITHSGNGELTLTEAIVVDSDARELTTTVTTTKSQQTFLPTEYALAQNQPNPFNPSTDITFSLPAAGHAKLTVFNMLGQEVAVLADAIYPAGVHRVVWTGCDAAGAPVASGVYLYRLTAGDFSATKKMVLMK